MLNALLNPVRGFGHPVIAAASWSSALTGQADLLAGHICFAPCIWVGYVTAVSVTIT